MSPAAEDTGAPIRVLVVDDQDLVRTGLAAILDSAPAIEVVGTAADGAAAVDMARHRRPRVVLMDVQMPVMDGIAATRAILAEAAGRSGPPAVVMLTTFDTDRYLDEALAAGASGFLLKDVPGEELIEAVRTVAGGDALLAPAVTRRVIAGMLAGRRAASPEPAGAADLTVREREVWLLMARAHSNGEIAAALVLGEATVKTHVKHILRKLGARDRVHAVVMAHEAGIVGSEQRTGR